MLHKIYRCISSYFTQSNEVQNDVKNSLAFNDTGVLDNYVSEYPSHELAFKIFEGQWASNIPGYGFGNTGLFQDSRINFFIKQCGGISEKKVLELGPLEGAHTYMLYNAGAKTISSIESNRAAYLKCLIVQNALKFKADFMLGDFRPYLDNCLDTFDLLVACGVLYHMIEPAKLLQDMAKVSSSIGIWTHYYDADIILNREDLKRKFDNEARVQIIGGRKVISYQQYYLDSLNYKGFCGGSAPISYWMTKESLLGVLSDLGLKVVIDHEDKNHPNGPCILLFASK